MNNRYDFLAKHIEDLLKQEYNTWYNSSIYKIVDCGCGDGHGSSILAARKNWEIHSFDFDNKCVNEAISKGLNAKNGDVRILDIPDLFADVYVCSETLEHLSREDSLKAAKNIVEKTAKPGFIVVTVPNDKKICLANKKHKQYLSPKDLENHFVDCVKVFEGKYCKNSSRCNTVMIFRTLL